jgi:hypothetical protein
MKFPAERFPLVLRKDRSAKEEKEKEQPLHKPKGLLRYPSWSFNRRDLTMKFPAELSPLEKGEDKPERVFNQIMRKIG